jgi:hypothetical protein
MQFLWTWMLGFEKIYTTWGGVYKAVAYYQGQAIVISLGLLSPLWIIL